MDEHQERELRAAVLAWWEGRRPIKWVEEDHVANPTVNCKTDAESALARCAAKLVRRSTPARDMKGRAEDARDAARFRWIEDNVRTQGGGYGFTASFYVPFDDEDIGCGIDKAIAAHPGGAAEGGKEE